MLTKLMFTIFRKRVNTLICIIADYRQINCVCIYHVHVLTYNTISNNISSARASPLKGNFWASSRLLSNHASADYQP